MESFQAELLMRIHHRNLVSFVGYCDDADHLALIYEYMANGNLKEYLSGIIIIIIIVIYTCYDRTLKCMM